jgi:hypothetical protein
MLLCIKRRELWIFLSYHNAAKSLRDNLDDKSNDTHIFCPPPWAFILCAIPQKLRGPTVYSSQQNCSNVFMSYKDAFISHEI